MKRAPIISKPSLSATPVAPTTAPAAPMVDSLISRVGAMTKGNSITLPVCGRDVKFTLETIPGKLIADKTMVWAGNERDQELLTEDALDDLIPSFLLTGQLNPAFGRQNDNLIEVADGSRRRKTAILTSSEYRILVGDLDDEQMDFLCKIGNDYRPTSAYERGKRYLNRLHKEFKGNISALAEAENISRKIITRCMSTAKLPREAVALFSHPGELSARTGEALHRSFADKEDLLISVSRKVAEKKQDGIIFEANEILQILNDALKSSSKTSAHTVTKREFLPGAEAQYKGNKVILRLDRSRVPNECIDKIEEILELFATSTTNK